MKANQCPKCKEYKHRSITVDAVIINANKVLLIKRANQPFKDFWALPGGFVDLNETLQEACIRETLEETNLEIFKLKQIGIYSKPSRDPKQNITVAFLVGVKGMLKADDDAKEAKWFKIDNLPKNIAFDHSEIIKDAIKLILITN